MSDASGQSRNEYLRARYGEAYKWMAGGAVVLGLLTTIFSSTMVNVALTDVMATFDVSQGDAQWLSTGFLCASSVAMLSTAWLVSQFGARFTFLIAIGVFVIGSLLGWQSFNFPILVIARLLQGAGAGILQPLSMSLIFLLFPADMRGRAMGLFGMGVVVGPAFGPVIGGIVTDSMDWHTTFSLVIPLALLSALLGFVFLPNRSGEREKVRFNITSFALIALSVAALLTAFTNSQFNPVTSTAVYPYFLIACIGFTLFFRRDWTSANPLVDLRLFKNLKFSSATMIGVFMRAGLFSSFYAIPLFARTVQGASATDAGMILFPAGLLMVIVFPVVGRLIDTMPAHRLILFGQVLFITSTFILSYSEQNTDYLYLAGWIIVGRVGLGFVMPSYSTFGLSSVPPNRVTQASGSLNFVRMVGGSIGVNLTAILITAKTNGYMAEVKTKTDGTLNEAQTIEVMTHTFQDVFVITATVFALALIPATYMLLTYRKEQSTT